MADPLNTETKWLSCPHCSGKGTCKNEADGSCGTCLKASKKTKDAKVVVCSVCNGFGVMEPKTERLRQRTPFLVVSMVLMAFYIFTTISLIKGTHTSEILSLIGSLTTMVVTFYFSGRYSLKK